MYAAQATTSLTGRYVGRGCALAALIFAIGAPQAVQAALLAEDGFPSGGPPNYNADTPFERNFVNFGGSPDGRINQTSPPPQNPSTTIGFSSPWTGPATSLWQVQDINLTYPNHPTGGGAAQYDWNSGDLVRQLSRPLTTGPTITPGSEFWMSGIVRQNALETDNQGAAYAGFGDTSSNLGLAQPGGASFFAENPNGWRIGLEATGSGGLMDLVFRHQDTGGSVASDVLLSDVTPGTDNLVVIRGVADGSGGALDQINIWVNPSVTGSTLELNINSALVLTDSSMDPGAFDLFLLQGFDIDNPGTAPGSGGVLFDEFRLGTTLQDVVANGNFVVPEPSTLMLFGMVIMPAVRRLRRRRRSGC